jgi:hypothetical protein
MNASTREQFERERANRGKRMAKLEALPAKAVEIPLIKGYLILIPVEDERPALDTPIYWNVGGHHGFHFCP